MKKKRLAAAKRLTRKNRLTAVASLEAGLLVTVLVAYLVIIAAALRDVARTLRLVTVGVEAMEKQTERLGPLVNDINDTLERATQALREGASSSTRS